MRHHDDPDNPEHGPHPDPFTRDQEGRAGGRHRKGGGARRRRPARRTSFRTGVTVAGAAAAVLTVATGVYVASVGSGPAVGAPPAVAPVAPPGATGDVSAASEAVREATPFTRPPASPATAPTPASHRAGTTPGGVTPSGAVPGTRPKAESERRQEERAPVRPQERRPEQQGVTPGAGVPAGKPARYVQEVVALANAERAKAGCGPLRAEIRLRAAAQAHADDMAARDYYEHDSPEGRDAGDRMSGAGYAWSTWGENIHRGPKTPERAMEDWMDSPGHRANILNCSFKDIGVGVTLTANGPWWVQDFGAKR
ncbi:CAP domain-containing protein [Streptomyces sp. P9-A4]|uniref:CAP domain-containing protein n=1 Tax=Streptomyces sp. P9-A4 TaxID=3072285 RepID=UPI002FC63649